MSLNLCKLECLRKSEAELKSDDDSAESEDINFTLPGHGDSKCEISSINNIECYTHSILPYLCYADASSDTVHNQSPEYKEVISEVPNLLLRFSLE